MIYSAMGKVPDPSKVDVRVKTLAPGIWLDGNGAAHFDIPELHKLFDIPNTPENINATRQLLRELLARELPDSPITERMGQDN